MSSDVDDDGIGGIKDVIRRNLTYQSAMEREESRHVEDEAAQIYDARIAMGFRSQELMRYCQNDPQLRPLMPALLHLNRLTNMTPEEVVRLQIQYKALIVWLKLTSTEDQIQELEKKLAPIEVYLDLSAYDNRDGFKMRASNEFVKRIEVSSGPEEKKKRRFLFW